MVACISLKNNSQLNDIQLYKYLRENLEQEKYLTKFTFLKELPKGISGKIQVEQLKKIILENRKKPSESGEATLEIIIQTAALTFKIDSNDITD
jgi:long-chain acyl-CoA synthetase